MTPKSPAKKAPATKAPATKAPAKKAPAKKAPAKKAPAKRTPATVAVPEVAGAGEPAPQAAVPEAAVPEAAVPEAAVPEAAVPVGASVAEVTSEGSASDGSASGATGKRAAAKRTVRQVRSAAGDVAEVAESVASRASARASAAVGSAQAAAARGAEEAGVLAPRRLSGFDFATWRSAANDPIMRSPMIGLIALDSSPEWQRLVDRFDRASRVAPVLRQKVVEAPSDLMSPRLVVDPEFDLSFHMRRFRVAEPGTWDQVLDEARRQSMTEFDLARPLWCVTLIEGLEGGRAALLIKLHHAIADGQGAMMLGATVIDLTPEKEDLGPMPVAPVGAALDTAGFLGTAMADASNRLMRSAKEIADAALPLAGRAIKDPIGAVDDLFKVLVSVSRFAYLPSRPMSPVMTGRSINYHFVTFNVPLADLKKAGKAHGMSLNDAYMAALAGGMRLYHERRGEPVEALRVNMPISLRDPNRPAQNAVTIARFEIPVDIADVGQRMAKIHDLVLSWRKEPALHLIDPLAEVSSRLMPSEVVSSAAQKSDFTASNVPGVPIPVYIGGARVLAMYPLMATVGAASNITLLSYNGSAGLGIAMDDAAIPDQAEFIQCVADGFAEVLGHPVTLSDPLA